MANRELSNLGESLNKNDDECETSISKFPTLGLVPTTSMATEDSPKQKLKGKIRKEHIVSPFHQNIISASHVASFLFAFLIIYYCFSGEFLLFTWHPLLLSIGWMFLMSESVLVMSKDNLLTGTLPKWLRVRLHWIFLLIAAFLILAGCLVAYITKHNLNKQHFKSWHAFFGLLALLGFVPAILDGVLVNYHGELKKYIKPRYNKFLHFLNGVLVYGFGGLALILSVYTKWFNNHSESILSFWLGLIFAVIAVTGTLIRPFISTSNIIQKMFEP